MQSSRNHIRMLCSIQTHRHNDTSSHENTLKYKPCHTLLSCYACSSSVLVGFYFWCPEALYLVVLHMLFLMPWGFIPGGLTLVLILCSVSNALGLYSQWSYTGSFWCPEALYLMILHMLCQDIFQPWSYIQCQWFHFMLMLSY
jgi:hypothetical protein